MKTQTLKEGEDADQEIEKRRRQLVSRDDGFQGGMEGERDQ